MSIEDVWDSEAEQEQLAVIVERRYESMLRAMHGLIADALGLDPVQAFRLRDEDTERVLRVAAERVVRIDHTTREAVREVLEEGNRLGLSGWQIANGDPKIGFRGIDGLFTETWKGRPDLIARTEIGESQRTSALNRYAASGLVDRVKVVDGDYDEVCAARNGRVVPIGDAPELAHPACLTPGQLVIAPNGEAASTRRFEGEVIVLRTAANDLLTCTPNHPILTDRGWVPAGHLRQRDHVVRCLDGQRVASAIDPDHDHRPTLIEDVADAFGPPFGSTSATMPLSAEDFHGDGAKGDVHVVRANRFCWNAPNGQHGHQMALDRALMSNAALFANRPLHQMLFGQMSTTYGRMSGGSMELAGLRGFSGVHKAHGFTGRSGQAVLSEPCADGCGIDTQVRGNAWGAQQLIGVEAAQDSFSGITTAPSVVPSRNEFPMQSGRAYSGDGRDVAQSLGALVDAVEVIEIQRVYFAGHVHNLQTTQGWYIASNIITHNCRLVVIPIVREATA